VAWAPFLERYAAQLPCLHEGLRPRTSRDRWPHLHEWFAAMQEVPAYACRVRGDDESWRRVLEMQGYGNAGRAPTLLERASAAEEDREASVSRWRTHAAARGDSTARSAAEECAAILVRNREAVASDAAARRVATAEVVDVGMRAVAKMLADEGKDTVASADDHAAPAADPVASIEPSVREAASIVAQHLEKRLCVPRDMGMPAALSLRALAAALEAGRSEG
jgi:glutathione S-transferase